MAPAPPLVRRAAFALLRPVLWLVFGLSVGNRERLPVAGPAIVAANHNSHADTLFLLSAFHRRTLPDVVPIAAADTFGAGFMGFVATRLLGAMPIDRRVARGSDPFAGPRAALAAGKILIVFPEGTRGEPEELGPLKSGVSKLAHEAGVPILPVWLQGAGRILPRGARLPVPFSCALLVGEPVVPRADRAATMAALAEAFAGLKQAAPPLHWH